MIKITKVIIGLFSIVLVGNAIALTNSAVDSKNTTNVPKTSAEIKGQPMPEWMMTKHGVVTEVTEKTVKIGDVIYKKNANISVYGVKAPNKTIKVGSYIRFNTNKDNEIIDIWVLK